MNPPLEKARRFWGLLYSLHPLPILALWITFWVIFILACGGGAMDHR